MSILLCCVATFFPSVGHVQTADSAHLIWRQQHLNYGSAFGFSHSGKILAVVDYPQIKLWDISADTFMRAIPIPARAFDQLAFSSDDREIVMLKSDTRYYGWREDDSDPPSSIMRLDLASGKDSIVPIASRGRGSWSLSPDGERIVMLSGNVLSVINTRSNTVVASKELPPFHGQRPILTNVDFVDNGSKIFVFRYGEAFLCDTKSLANQAIIGDSIKWRAPKLSGDGIFIRHDYGDRNGVVIDARKSEAAALQPLRLKMPIDGLRPGLDNEFSEIDDATLFGGGEYLATRYILWRGMMCGNASGPPPGEDSVLFTALHDPTLNWGVRLRTDMRVIGQAPHHPSILFFSDGHSILSADAKTGRIAAHMTYLHRIIGFAASGLLMIEGESVLYALDPKTGITSWSQQNVKGNGVLSPKGDEIATFTENRGTVVFGDDGHLKANVGESPDRGYIAAFLEGRALLLKTDYTGPTTLRTGSHNSKPERTLDPFLRYLPYGEDSLIAYSNFWSTGDSAVLYDYSADKILKSYIGGLNRSIEAAAVSHDKKWLVTIPPGGAGKLWRISDGALKKCFGLLGRHTPQEVQFTPNDRFLVYSGDTAFFSYDLLTDQTAVALPKMGESNFTFSRDGSTVAIANSLNGLSAYDVPVSWQQHFKLDPKQNFLFLRWYLPATAREAIDTTGKPFVPARTIAEVELRYADGRLLKKIVNGPFHKGKWHGWEVDMTEFPPGKYIMHSEIGGEVKDETLELK